MREKLTDALKEAMKIKDSMAVATLRLILAALKDRDIAARGKGKGEISDDEILAMLQTMIKQRRESITLYEQGGRLELAEQEAQEITIIERFMPQMMDDAAMQAAIDACIEAVGASGIKDMGVVMNELKQRHPGQMDFARASAVVKAALQSK